VMRGGPSVGHCARRGSSTAYAKASNSRYVTNVCSLNPDTPLPAS
jgi:hypothetical protein